VVAHASIPRGVRFVDRLVSIVSDVLAKIQKLITLGCSVIFVSIVKIRAQGLIRTAVDSFIALAIG